MDIEAKVYIEESAIRHDIGSYLESTGSLYIIISQNGFQDFRPRPSPSGSCHP